LIEIMMVVAILGIIFAIGIPLDQRDAEQGIVERGCAVGVGGVPIRAFAGDSARDDDGDSHSSE